jgi:hypothetical protein
MIPAMTLATEVEHLLRERAALERQVRTAQDHLRATYPELIASAWRAEVSRDPMRGIATTPRWPCVCRRVV